MKKACVLLLALTALVSAACARPRVERRLIPVPGPRPIPDVKLPALTHAHTSECPSLDTNKAHIVCILDRSGSMQPLTGDTIGGYNSFIEKQRAEAGTAKVTTVLFDDRYETLCDGEAIADVKPLTEKEYYARGTTALLDAVGSTILRIDAAFKKTGICPRSELVIFMIMTDGLENASREFNRAAVKKLVSDAQEMYGWKFIFMGANIDSAAEAGSIGIGRQGAMDYAADSAGVGAAYESAGSAVRSFRAGGRLDDSWKKAPAPEK